MAWIIRTNHDNLDLRFSRIELIREKKKKKKKSLKLFHMLLHPVHEIMI